MLKTFAATLIAVALLSPAEVDAYGAAHVGYTHVGPNGVQHYGETAYRGPNSAGVAAHGSAYGANGAYHAGTAAAVHLGAPAAGGYHYSAGAATGGAYHYAYVR
jgi:hypothetical protein